MAKETMAALRKCVYPYPVYEAKLRIDGTFHPIVPMRIETLRLSFWSRLDKPLDVNLPRWLVAAFRPGVPMVNAWVHDKRTGERHRDPAFGPSALNSVNGRKRGPTAKQCLGVIARLVDGDESAMNDARALLDKAA